MLSCCFIFSAPNAQVLCLLSHFPLFNFILFIISVYLSYILMDLLQISPTFSFGNIPSPLYDSLLKVVLIHLLTFTSSSPGSQKSWHHLKQYCEAGCDLEQVLVLYSRTAVSFVFIFMNSHLNNILLFNLNVDLLGLLHPVAASSSCWWAVRTNHFHWDVKLRWRPFIPALLLVPHPCWPGLCKTHLSVFVN